MTISTTTSRIAYSGNGATTVFSFPYLFFVNGDLTVELVNAAGVADPQVLDTDYTVTGAGNDAGGSVTMIVAPASGERLVIRRVVALTQETAYPSGDPFPAETHERGLDKVTMLAQQNQEVADRALVIPSSDTQGTNVTLPNASSRADKILRFDSDGNVSLSSIGDITGVVTDASAVEFTPAGTGAVATTVQEFLRQFVSVKGFGAVGDGVTDDTAAATAAHVYANSVGRMVSYAGISRIAIQADAQIPMKTSTDFQGCEIVILGGVEGTPSFSTYNRLFVVTDDDCPLTSITGAVTSTNLTKGAMFPTLGLFDGHGYARLSCAYQVPDRDKTATVDYEQTFKVNRNGRVSQPLSVDISAFAAAITVQYRKTSAKRLTISNVSAVEGAWNNQVVFNIKRCNVKVSGFTMLFTGAGSTFNNICALVLVEDASDIFIEDFVTTGRPVTTTVGSYCLDVEGGADIFVDRMNALTGWGATGCNFINGMYYSRCVLNRLDVHQSAHNVFADNCDLHEAGMVYGWGGGVLSVKNSRLLRCSAIANRQDYGNTFFGDLVVSDCEVNNNFTATYRLIDLESNPLGASSDVYAPQTITVSNVRRVGRATGSNAEFIPVAIKVRGATDVVYAPTQVSVSNIGCHPSWRFGLRLDTLNMEGNPSTPLMRINVDRVTPDAAATSTTGILDLTSIRTPTTAVRPQVRVANSENIHISLASTTNTEVIVEVSSVNGISTVTGALNTVSVKNCRLLVAATGYANAPIGAGVSGAGGHTILENCEIGAIAFDLSLVAAAIGNTIRTGGSAPLLPGAATTTTFFTGYRQAAVFA